jgi:hypothetical protein
VINRKFVYPGWEYSLKKFDELAKRKDYAIRFRLEYFHLNSEKTKLKQLIKVWLLNVAALFKTAFVILKYQLKGGTKINDSQPVIILVTRNNVYLQTLKPLILYLAKKQSNIIVLCPSKHYRFILGYLGAEVGPYLSSIESVHIQKGMSGRIFRLLTGLFKGFFDAVWFVFQPIKKSFWFAPVFGRFGLTQYYFGKSLEMSLKTGAKLIAANDHWMWESLYFTSARKVNANCYVTQHGVTGDISYPIFADQFLAWGKYDFEKFQKELGAQQNEVKIIGSPHFDEVYVKIADHKTASTQFQKPFLTFLSQPFFNSNFIEPGYYQKILDRFVALTSIADSFQKELVIKLHPGDKIEYYKHFPSNIKINKDSLLDVLDNTCIAFTVDSTAIFEAVIYGIPVMQCGVENMKRALEFSSSGLCDTSVSVDTILSFTQNMLQDESFYNAKVKQGFNALEQYFYGIGGTLERFDQLLNSKNR